MINLKIDNKVVSVKEGTTILEAAQKLNINIPTLCYLKEINEISSCRICLVEVVGIKNLVPACSYKVTNNMEVLTDTDKVIDARKKNLELILSCHQKDCNNCLRNGKCELQKLLVKYNINEENNPNLENISKKDESTSYLIRDNNKCILCNRCVAVCKKIQEIAVIGKNKRGMETHIGCAFEKELNEAACIACGQCSLVCPTGAITEKDETDKVIEAINNKDLHVVVATAPAVRVALGEEFGLPIGTNVKGKMVTALKELGFDKVFDINLGADFTIIEEATELIERINNKGTLPMFTSCSPGWIKYVEHYHPDMIKHLSTCKSPQQMFGAIIKTYYAQKNNIDPKNIFVVTIMPCVAKKFEAKRESQNASGYPDIDLVLTTRELARLIKKKSINFSNLTDSDFDNPLGYGASVIFGNSGGVMEAALRTIVEIATKKPLEKIDFLEVRGTKGIKEATYNINNVDIKVAVVSGISNAKKMLKKIKNKEVDYHFVEFMTCPGGCINGGGQPIVPANILNNNDVKKLRMNALLEEDRNLPIRKAHDNPIIKKIYSEFLSTIGKDKVHKILHTTYKPREK